MYVRRKKKRENERELHNIYRDKILKKKQYGNIFKIRYEN